MKAIFIVFHALAEYSGITKKIRYQVKALNDCGVETELCYLGWDEFGNQVRWVGDKVQKNFGTGIKAKIEKRFEYNSLYHYIIDNNISLVYMRSLINAEPFIISFAKKLRKKGVKVVMEIPTFPYDHEGKELPLPNKIRFYINKLFRYSQAKNLDAIITFSDYDMIFNQRTIKISNGVDFDSLPLKKTYREKPSILQLLVVAELHYWHGVDRAISGLAEYVNTNDQQKVHLNIVGKPERASGFALKQQVEKLGLNDYITFYGPLSGDDLDRVFEKADFGIGSLGRHRSNITKIKTLKNREYAARGLGFIYSEIDDDFEAMPYIIKAKADEDPISIKSIVDFYFSHNLNPLDIRKTIEPNLSWKNQMQKVIFTIFAK
ncbi:MAG: glycosyltransferase family 1 protein [Bacteroidales bacterium]|nr:glycosyltransferase family 1 protein [Bacteroidales bacterium]